MPEASLVPAVQGGRHIACDGRLRDVVRDLLGAAYRRPGLLDVRRLLEVLHEALHHLLSPSLLSGCNGILCSLARRVCRSSADLLTSSVPQSSCGSSCRSGGLFPAEGAQLIPSVV